jgi:hypothetical protein
MQSNTVHQTYQQTCEQWLLQGSAHPLIQQTLIAMNEKGTSVSEIQFVNMKW